MTTTKVGQPAPDFALECVTAANPVARRVTLDQYSGRWLMLIFYPRDFTFVCPTELTAFSARRADFVRRNCDLLGISVDSIELHREWLSTPPDDGGLGPLQFPLAADPDGAAAKAYGVWVEEKEVSTRGLFIVHPAGILQYAVVHNLSVGRNPDEVLRVLDALQTGGLCPASWTLADGTIDPERALRPGSILGHYRIRKMLGGGTFGTVFAAWDMKLERMVALKVLKRNVLESREALLAESRAAAKLNHPHVCIVYAVGEEDGLPMIVMEYLGGHTLSRTIADGLDRQRALRLAAQLATGLAAAHAQGIVHGDLKPANIMVTEDGAAKILDFGLARSQPASEADSESEPEPAVPVTAVDETGEADGIAATIGDSVSNSARQAVIRGTPAYMSPEQARGRPSAPASDVFAFGLILFEILTGRQALTGQSPLQLITKLQSQDIGEELTGRIEPPCRELIRAMLAPEPDQRPTMPLVREAINAWGKVEH